jgi:hypothetical protein
LEWWWWRLTRLSRCDAMCCLQLKDMVLKFSGSSKQCKGTAGTQSFRSSGDRYRRPYPGFIDDTGFTPASKVLGEDYYPRTALAGAAGAAGGARTASSDTLDMGRSNRKSPGSSGWIPGTDEAAAGGDDVLALEDAAAPREWTAQVEPGVQITFGTIPSGGNDLKRIRFRCVRCAQPTVATVSACSIYPLWTNMLLRSLILAL